jgi:hypothetical protein
MAGSLVMSMLLHPADLAKKKGDNSTSEQNKI